MSSLRKVTLVGGRKIYAHVKADCKGDFCCIHKPSNHHMRSWKQFFRSDRGIMERLCPEHGVGHPDPDDYAILSGSDPGIHGCCGCCFNKEK